MSCLVCACAQLHYRLNLQTRNHQQCPLAWIETLGLQAPGWAPVAGQEGTGTGLLEEAARVLTSRAYQEL